MGNNTLNYTSKLASTYHSIFIETLFIWPILIIITGFASNIWTLLILFKKTCSISKISKMYYIVIGISDLIIILKIMLVFALQASCYWEMKQVCNILKGSSIIWKFILSVWLGAESVSNYSIVWLSIERWVAVSFPVWARAHVNLKWNLSLIVVSTLPLSIYCFVFGCILYEISDSAKSFSKIVIDVDLKSPHVHHFSVITKIFVFAFPTLIGFIFSVLIMIQLKRARTKRASLTQTERKQSQNSNRSINKNFSQSSLNTKLTRGVMKVSYSMNQLENQKKKEIRSTVIAMLLSSVNCLLYFPTLIIWMVLHIYDLLPGNLNEKGKETKDDIMFIAIYMFTLTGIAHSFNFFVYFFCIRSFKRNVYLMWNKLCTCEIRVEDPIRISWIPSMRGESAPINPTIEL